MSRDAVNPAAAQYGHKAVDDVRHRRAGRRVVRGGGVVRGADADRPLVVRRERAGRQQLDVLAVVRLKRPATVAFAAFGSRAIATVGVNVPPATFVM